jgi:hypothetical protein
MWAPGQAGKWSCGRRAISTLPSAGLAVQARLTVPAWLPVSGGLHRYQKRMNSHTIGHSHDSSQLEPGCDVTLIHSANTLAFAGASSGYTFDAEVLSSLAGNERIRPFQIG